MSASKIAHHLGTFRMVNTLDPIPTFLLKESLDLQLSYLTAMINASLRYGCLPVSQKHAIISPLFKNRRSTMVRIIDHSL